MEKLRAILHIGTHKAGSTALQNFFRRNYEPLIERGFLWIDESYSWPSEWKKLSQSGDLSSRYLDDLASQVYAAAELTQKTLLLSSEGFGGFPSEGYQDASFIAETSYKLLQPFNVQIVLYCRRQDIFYESWYVQRIQEGNYYGFDEFWKNFSFKNLDYSLIIQAYSSIFEPHRLTVRPYIKGQLDRDSVTYDFVKSFNIENIEGLDFEVWGNNSMSPAAVRVARCLNERLPSSDQRSKLRFLLQATSSQKPFKSHKYLTLDQRREILSYFREFNETLCFDWFKLQDNVFDLTFDPPSLDSTKNSDVLTIEDLAEVVMCTLLKLAP